MMPTNPISPATATAAAVASDAATTTTSRSRPTFSPRLCASMSPTSITSRSRRTAQSVPTASSTDGSASRTSSHPVVPSRPRIQRVDLPERLRALLLEERLHGGQERGDRHAREDQARRRAAPEARASEPVGEPDAADGPEERSDRHGHLDRAGGAVRHGDRRAEPRAGGRAEQVRVGERVAEDRLVGRAGCRERRPDEPAHDHPREPQVPEDRRLLLRHPGRARRRTRGATAAMLAAPIRAGPTSRPAITAATSTPTAMAVARPRALTPPAPPRRPRRPRPGAGGPPPVVPTATRRRRRAARRRPR